jgi:hypothetical protein
VSYEAFTSGAVVFYPYLWSREAQRGETGGRKHRPTVVAVRVPRPDRPDLVILFPITTKLPEPGRFAAEVPEMEKRRAGLDPSLRQWIILDECNEESIPGSYYLEPEPALGKFSKRFFLPLVLDFIKRRERVRIVSRRD